MKKKAIPHPTSVIPVSLGVLTLSLSAGIQAQTVAPVITSQPTPKAVSLGANATFTVSASGSTPLSYQWRLSDTDLPEATNSVLVFTNVQFNESGDYHVVVTNSSGAVTSLPARLSVGPAFTKMTASPVASGTGGTGGAWGDFNHDGLLDLFVSFGNGSASALYTNSGNSTFVKDTGAGIGAGTGSSWGSAWGDYDNDGNLDLIGSVYGGNNYALRNNGNGTFTRIMGDPLVSVGTGNNVIWADYDNDGFLDAFFAGSSNFLFHNNGNGSFTRVTNSIATRDGSGQGCAWGDYDNDGFSDLFVTRVNQPNLLYHNNREGTFARITNAPFASDSTISQGCSWGDYDNDGYLDLVVCNFGARNVLYHNEGNGHFSRVTNSIVANVVANSSGSAWADYDNDGYLDLFIAVRGGVNLLFHNNGDGTFTRVTAASLLNDNGTWIGGAWGDFNNDGFPDLFIGNLQGNNALYLNGGNSNNWITITCAGRISNRSAIGAKVRLKATIRGKEFWQLREISGGGGLACQNDPRAQFGLGDATTAEVIRIEWPSGSVQEFRNVPSKQFLVVREPSQLRLDHVTGTHDQRLTLIAGTGVAYSLESSTDLTAWSSLISLTNETGTFIWTNQASGDPVRYFRAQER